ncbi:MAG: hypothetical protein HON45_00550, partial [Polaribacter sp.]|nr:hypothetical protein [Polaribacter sp.]
MKKILAFVFLISSSIQAQYTINGSMSPAVKSDWIILYEIESTKLNYVQHSKIKLDTINAQG